MCSRTFDVSLGVFLETMDVSCDSECFWGQWMNVPGTVEVF
jgi:hypothetical protein